MSTRNTKRVACAAFAIVMAVVSAMFIVFTGSPEAEATYYVPIGHREEYKLTEAEWRVVDTLTPQCKDIVTGARTSTIFTVDASGLLDKTEFTYDDFGVEVVDMEHLEPDGMPEMNITFTNSVHNLLCGKIMRCLMVLRNERPSLMDWFDGTITNSIDTGWDIAQEQDGWHAHLRDVSIYAARNDSCRSSIPYEVSPDGIRRIQECVKVAQGIVDRHAGEPAEQKVRSWASEIDALTTYDNNAVPEDSGTRYYYGRDPWFFTSVFDCDPSTKTVCEGYARAFALLFELSGDTDVSCRPVYGGISTTAKGGPHAWNLVRMPDGRNYIVDLTNNRTGSPGEGQFTLLPAAGSVDTEYQVTYDGDQPVWYSYSNESTSVYQSDALAVSDTPYVAPEPEEATEPVDGEPDQGDAQEEDAEPAEEVAEIQEPDVIYFPIDQHNGEVTVHEIAPKFETEDDGDSTSPALLGVVSVAIVTVLLVVAGTVVARRTRRMLAAIGFVLLAGGTASMMVATIAAPEVAQAAPCLDPVPESVCALSYEEQDLLWDFQQRCYEITTGARTSTEFPLDVSSMLGKTDFDASDYGIDPVIVDYEVDGSTGEERATRVRVNPDILQAIADDLRGPVDRVVSFLRAERPSLTEWFEPLRGYPVSFDYEVGGPDGDWCASITGAAVRLTPVDICSTGGYEVDPGGIARIQQALSVAQGIADRHAGEPSAQRLLSWRDEIESLATRMDTYDPYGDRAVWDDPWYATSVFDCDPSTPTVCEGYAKALKVLYELSGCDADCHVAWGTAATNAGSVNHSWDVVGMDDGRNYIVDIFGDRPGTNLEGLLVLVPAQGSVSGGYSVDTGNGNSVWYGYDGDTLDAFQWGELEVSDTPCEGLPAKEEPVEEEAEEVEEEEPAPEPVPVEKKSESKPVEDGAQDKKADGEKGEEPEPIVIENIRKTLPVMTEDDAWDDEARHALIATGFVQVAAALAASPVFVAFRRRWLAR